jgi:hypothetical protein
MRPVATQALNLACPMTLPAIDQCPVAVRRAKGGKWWQVCAHSGVAVLTARPVNARRWYIRVGRGGYCEGGGQAQ